MGGLCKFWDGYNNQQIVVIDDPGVFNVTMTDAEANAFKNVVSHGSHTVEIKGSSFSFDSKLVVIISNVPPHQLAESAGKFHRDAIADRIMGHRSIIHQAYHVPNKAARSKFREDFCRIIVAMYNHFNVEIEQVKADTSSDMLHLSIQSLQLEDSQTIQNCLTCIGQQLRSFEARTMVGVIAKLIFGS